MFFMSCMTSSFEDATGNVKEGPGMVHKWTIQEVSRSACGNGLRFPASICNSNWRLPMPAFHFNSFTDGEVLPDVEGEELPNVYSAREVAKQSAREASIEAVKTGDIAPDCIQVTDSEGREIVTVFLKDLLDG